ncbi:MAG TPA: hypothetical protein VNZ22_01525, partial [Bacillota bacterium]|nr:hypothetical protein [Bacillota bacterium]
VSGTLNLTQTGKPSSTLKGPVQFIKSSSNPSNELTLQPGTLTSDWLPVNTFTNHLFYRDTTWPANYFGYLEFEDDGNPWSYCPYSLWVLSINDPNDADHNGLPDFSDLPVVIPPARRPQLSLARSGNTLQLTIRGDVGHLHQVQEATSLASPAWQTVSSVTLTTDPQTISLPLPAGTTKFWRVQAQ